VRLDNDQKKSGLREVLTGTDYKSAPAGGGEILEMPGYHVNIRVPVQKILGMPW
jgi:hypothetical protein